VFLFLPMQEESKLNSQAPTRRGLHLSGHRVYRDLGSAWKFACNEDECSARREMGTSYPTELARRLVRVS
jgi:hypothetical protein